jgi:hypothetical protein
MVDPRGKWRGGWAAQGEVPFKEVGVGCWRGVIVGGGRDG